MTDEQYDYYLRLGYRETYLDQKRLMDSVSRSLQKVGASFAEVARAADLFATAWRPMEGTTE